MPRNMSFSLTTQQMRDRTKTVTRRKGWAFLKPGEIVNACVQCQGLGKGGKVERICQLRIVSNDPEPLADMLKAVYGKIECVREGFPKMSGRQFVEMFCRHMGGEPSQVVNRIEFEFV